MVLLLVLLVIISASYDVYDLITAGVNLDRHIPFFLTGVLLVITGIVAVILRHSPQQGKKG
jgi:hypothetical protein